MILGLLWTYVATNILMDLLGTFVILFKLEEAFMGLTLLGNYLFTKNF